MAGLQAKRSISNAVSASYEDPNALAYESLYRHCAQRKLSTKGTEEQLRQRLELWWSLETEAALALQQGSPRPQSWVHVATTPARSLFDPSGWFTTRWLATWAVYLLLRFCVGVLSVSAFEKLSAPWEEDKIRQWEPDRYQDWLEWKRTNIVMFKVVFTLASILYYTCGWLVERLTKEE